MLNAILIIKPKFKVILAYKYLMSSLEMNLVADLSLQQSILKKVNELILFC